MLRIPIAQVRKLCVLYLLLWSVCPPLGIDMIFRIMALGAAALWLFYEVKQKRKFDGRIVLFLVLVVVVNFFPDRSFSDLLKQIPLFMLGIACFMYLYYQEHMEELKGIAPMIIALLALWNIRTYSELLINPNIARDIVRNDEEIYQFMRQGVGGYALIYMQVCILPIVLSWCLQAFQRHKLQFVIGVVWLLSFVSVIGKAGYSIAITASVVSVFMLFFYKGKSAVPAVLIALVIIGVTLSLIIYSEGFRNFLLLEFEGTTVTKKIDDLVSSVHQEQAVDSIAIRIRRYKASLEIMLQYPLVGGLWWEAGGGHSAILDNLARYGWFGGYVYVKSIFAPLQTIRNRFRDSYTLHLMNAMIVSVLMVALLDSFSYEFMFVLVLFVPMLYQDILDWRNEGYALAVGSESDPERGGESTSDEDDSARRLGGSNEPADLQGAGN